MSVAAGNDSELENRTLDPDVQLMLRVKEEDTAAFEQLMELYQHRVIGVLYHMVGNAEEAEDLAQEVFLRVYRSRKGYKPVGKFSTWVFTIANNLALNAIRDRKRKPVREATGSDSGPLGPRPLEQLVSSPSGAMPSRIFAQGEMSAVVRAAVQQLSEEQRMAVMLNKFEDMSYRQIAEIMNKSEMAVKSLLSRARSSLREILDPYLRDGTPPRE